MRHAALRAILLVGFIYPATVVVARERIGAFSYVTASDPMTDEDASYIVTNVANSTLTTEGRLIWRCDSDQMGLLLDADEFLNTAGRVDVIWRFDRDDPMLGSGISARVERRFSPGIVIDLSSPSSRFRRAQLPCGLWITGEWNIRTHSAYEV